MPRLTRWSVRAALLYLATGFTLGGLMLFNKGVPLSVWLWRLLPAHVEFLLLGWTMQLAAGVGFWILPRFGSVRRNEEGAWLSVILLNVGVLIVGLGQMLGAPGWVTLAGRLAEVGAALTFIIHAWPRVKPLGD